MRGKKKKIAMKINLVSDDDDVYIMFFVFQQGDSTYFDRHYYVSAASSNLYLAYLLKVDLLFK